VNSPYAWGGLLGDTRKQAAEAYFMYVEDASADARSKDPKCITSVTCCLCDLLKVSNT